MSANKEVKACPSPMMALVPLMIGLISFCFYILAVHDLKEHCYLIYAMGEFRARMVSRYVLLIVFSGSTLWYAVFLKRFFDLGWKKLGSFASAILFGVLASVCCSWAYQRMPATCLICRRGLNSERQGFSTLCSLRGDFSYEDRVLSMYRWKVLCRSVRAGTICAAILGMLECEEARQCAYEILLRNCNLDREHITWFSRLGRRDQLLLCMMRENFITRCEACAGVDLCGCDFSQDLFSLSVNDLWARVGVINRERMLSLKKLYEKSYNDDSECGHEDGKQTRALEGMSEMEMTDKVVDFGTQVKDFDPTARVRFCGPTEGEMLQRALFDNPLEENDEAKRSKAQRIACVMHAMDIVNGREEDANDDDTTKYAKALTLARTLVGDRAKGGTFLRMWSDDGRDFPTGQAALDHMRKLFGCPLDDVERRFRIVASLPCEEQVMMATKYLPVLEKVKQVGELISMWMLRDGGVRKFGFDTNRGFSKNNKEQ